MEPDRYILHTVEFEGGGNYLSGIKHKDSRANWQQCKGIRNTIRTAEFGFSDNTQATRISAADELFVIVGTAQPGLSLGRFELDGSGAVYRGTEAGMFDVTTSVSIETSNTHEYKIALMLNGDLVPMALEKAKPIKRSDSMHRFDIHKLLWLDPGDRVDVGICADGTGLLSRDPIATDLITIIKEVF